MKKLLLALILILPVFTAHAVTVKEITFKITSSAATASPNLRVMKMSGGVKVQGMAMGNISNYYLTKSQTFQLEGLDAILIQVDQETKMYTNDATNYITIYNDIDSVFTVQK